MAQVEISVVMVTELSFRNIPKKIGPGFFGVRSFRKETQMASKYFFVFVLVCFFRNCAVSKPNRTKTSVPGKHEAKDDPQSYNRAPSALLRLLFSA